MISLAKNAKTANLSRLERERPIFSRFDSILQMLNEKCLTGSTSLYAPERRVSQNSNGNIDSRKVENFQTYTYSKCGIKFKQGGKWQNLIQHLYCKDVATREIPVTFIFSKASALQCALYCKWQSSFNKSVSR